MIQPQTVSEKLLFSTVRLETNKGMGTGFFFHFLCGDKGSCCPGIITNKHVVGENPQQEVRFFLHLKEESDLKPANESVGIAYKADWICHPNLDLCFAPTNPLIQKLKTQTQKEIYYTPLDEGFKFSVKHINLYLIMTYSH